MPRRLRRSPARLGRNPRLIVAPALALLALAGAAPAPAVATSPTATTAAAPPPGPRLAFDVARPLGQDDGIETVDSAGGDRRLLVGGGGEKAVHPFGDRPAFSPDGRLLAFTSSFGEYSPVIYLVGAGGGRPRLLSKTTPLSDPVFTPDGRFLAFSVLRVVKGEFQRPARRSDEDDEYGVVVDWAVLAYGVDGKSARLLTPWRRNQVLRPTSFSPDGATMVAERESRRGLDAVAVDLRSDRIRLLARGAEEPVLSPDGTRVAFVETERTQPQDSSLNPRPASSTLSVMAAAGGPATALAGVEGGLAWPSWDPSGQRLAFTRLGGGSFGIGSHPQEGNSLMQVNADGSCLTKLFSAGRGTVFGSAWQPGPGREAGPISC